MADENRIMTRHPQGKDGVNILKRRYEIIKKFILETIQKHGEITYSELNDLAVEKLTASFDGKVTWYIVTVKLDLEARNTIDRIPKTSPHKLRMKSYKPMKTIDEYIDEASEVTRPIVSHLRTMIHTASPEIEENIKWNAPSFELGGKIVCSVMAFKKHVNFMFSQGKQLHDDKNLLENIGEKSNMKGIKQIAKVSDLPDDKILINFIQQAARISKGY